MINEYTEKSTITIYKADESCGGIPLGNGTSGALITFDNNNIKLNLYHQNYGITKVNGNIDTGGQMKNIRQLAKSGNVDIAEEMLMDAMKGIEITPGKSAFIGSVDIVLSEPATDGTMKGQLDLENGIARISWQQRDTVVNIEIFHTQYVNALCSRINTNGNESIDMEFNINTNNDEGNTSWHETDNRGPVLTTIKDDDISSIQIDVKTGSGRINIDADGVSIKDENELWLTIGMAASHDGSDTTGECDLTVEQVIIMEYDQLIERTGWIMRDFYSRIDVNFSDIASPQLNILLPLSRYLAASSMRQGGGLTDKGGIWGNDGNYNFIYPLHYWYVLSSGLTELLQPLLGWLENNMDKLAANAVNIHGEKGVFLPSNVDIDANPATKGHDGIFNLIWAGGSIVTADILYRYWKINCDDEFMQRQLWPLLSASATFTSSITDIVDEAIQINPSVSPGMRRRDGSWLVDTSSMDIAMVEELITRAADLAIDNDPDTPLLDKWNDILDNIPALPMDADGIIKEWMDDEPAIRNSRMPYKLWGLFPGNRIDYNDTMMRPAMNTLLKMDVDGVLPKAASYIAAAMVRAGMSDRALELIEKTMSSVGRFGFIREADGSITLECLYAMSLAVMSMLINSDEEKIEILPSLPDRLHTGSASDLPSWGGYEFSFEWRDKIITSLKVMSRYDGLCRFTTGIPIEIEDIYENGVSIPYLTYDRIISFETKAEKVYKFDIV